jgi:hypothetical protein
MLYAILYSYSPARIRKLGSSTLEAEPFCLSIGSRGEVAGAGRRDGVRNRPAHPKRQSLCDPSATAPLLKAMPRVLGGGSLKPKANERSVFKISLSVSLDTGT